MVVRKPPSTNASIPVTSSSCSPLDLASLSSPSDEIFTKGPTTAQDPSLGSDHHSRSSIEPQDGGPQPFHIVPSTTRCPPREEKAPGEKHLWFDREADQRHWSVEDLHDELLDISKAGFDVSQRATPRSSQESERSRKFEGEDISGSVQARNVTKQSDHFSRLDIASMPIPATVSCSTPSDTPVSSYPELAQAPENIRSKNPFRQGSVEKKNLQDSLNDGLLHRSRRGKCQEACLPPETSINTSSDGLLYDRLASEKVVSGRFQTMDLGRVSQDHKTAKRFRAPSSSRIPESTHSPSPPAPSSSESTIEIDQLALIPVLTGAVEGITTRPSQSTLLDNLAGPAEHNFSSKEEARSGAVAHLEKRLPTIWKADFFPSAESPISASFHAFDERQPEVAAQSRMSQEPHLQDRSSSEPVCPTSPSSTTAETESARLKEQRNETYQIKHFGWFDHNSRTLRRSSMLTQNNNGPCPLLALVNALILDVENDSRSALGAALRSREQVSLGLIIESLMDELTSEGRCEEFTELPDVDELNRFLVMLHTGMTANPRLAASASPSADLMNTRTSSLHPPLSLNDDRKPGTFEATQDMRLYGAFAIPLVHGWLAPRSDPARAAFGRSAQTYEDAQMIQFGEEELENKLSRVGLNSTEQQLLQDISAIKSFLESYPTQITPYGLGVINESLFPGAFAILFRNDHFSTIYKHPESGQLFTLVTDAGYSDKDEVIWESLVDVSGKNSEFFSGDFRPVGNVDAHSEAQQAQHDHSSKQGNPQHLSQFYENASPPSHQGQQQQTDADFAMALQLQEEEQARIDDSGRRLSTNDAVQNRNPAANNPQSTREWDRSRPAIPTRNARNQSVNRPLNPGSDEAPPPAYEEAARSKPYVPPVGHPQHASFDARSLPSEPSVLMLPPGPRTGQASCRRLSASQERQFHGNWPLAQSGINNAIGVPQNPARPRDKDKDCTVM